MSDLGELRARVETAQRQLKCLEDQRREQNERLVELIGGVEAQMAERQATLDRQADEIQDLKQDNAELRALLDLLLRSAEDTSHDVLGDAVDKLNVAMADKAGGETAAPDGAPMMDDAATAVPTSGDALAEADVPDPTAPDPSAPTNGAPGLAAPDAGDDSLDMALEDDAQAAGPDGPTADAALGVGAADDDFERALDATGADATGADAAAPAETPAAADEHNGAAVPALAPAPSPHELDPHEIATAEDLPMGPEAAAGDAARADESLPDETPADEIPEPTVEEREGPAAPEIPDTGALVMTGNAAIDALALGDEPLGDPVAVRKIIARVSQIAEEMSDGVEPAAADPAATEGDATTPEAPEAAAEAADLSATA